MMKVTYVVSWVDSTLTVDYLKTCLESLSQQKGIQSEIILVSNVNQEILNSVEVQAILSQYQVLSLNEAGYSLGKLQQLGLSKATGDYVSFINSKDFLINDVVLSLLKSETLDEADIVVGQTMCYDAYRKTMTLKPTNTSMGMSSLRLTKDVGMMSSELLNHLTLENKWFRLDFLKENEIELANTHYLSSVLFQLKALAQARRVVVSPLHSYNERAFDGLEKLNHPTLEETIDVNQVSDVVQVFLETMTWAESVQLPIVQQMMINQYLTFVFKRGLNYLNVSETPEEVFEWLGKPLSLIEVSGLKRNVNQKTILSFLEKGDYEGYLSYIQTQKALKTKQKSLPKHIKRQLFIKLYEFGRKLPVNEKEVLFVSHSPGMDGNYSFIKGAIDDYNSTVKMGERFTYKNTSTKISAFQKLFLPLKLARAEFILVAEYVPFFQLLNFREETKVVQTWHAAGAFKKFGYSTSYLPGGPNPFKGTKMHLHRGYDYATVSSEEVKRHYAEAFEMDLEKVIPIGFPRADFFYDEKAVVETKERLYQMYPMLKGKKVILYAPTFRGVGKTRTKFKMEFDVNRIAREISDDYVIALKLHPSVQSSDIVIDGDVENKVIDLSPYKEANDILTLTDLLITDYSSIIFDYSLLRKPMLFYAYDLDDYRFDRDFYYDYETFVPGPIAKTNDDVIRVINEGTFDLERVKTFSETFFVSQTGDHSKRFVEEVLVKLSK